MQRRSVHRSRSTAVTIALTVLALLAIWVGLEAVLAAVGARPLLVDPQSAVDAALRPTAAGSTITVAAAVVLVAIGVVLIVLAVAPGRQHRRPVALDRAVVVVDDRIIATTAVSAAASASGIAPNQIEAWTRGRTVGVRVRPTTGVPADEQLIERAVRARLDELDTRIARRVDVRIAPKGVLA
jgi:transposase-like protein